MANDIREIDDLKDLISDSFNPSRTLEDIKEEFKTALHHVDKELDLREGQPWMNIASVFAIAMEALREYSMNIYNDLSPYTASLPTLINCYGTLYGVEYKKGAKTLIKLQIITDDKAQTIPLYHETTFEHTAFQVAGSLTGNVYVPQKDIVLHSNGTYIVDFESETEGAFYDEVGTINNILTTTLGVKSVTNLGTYYSLGSEIETKEEYGDEITKATRLYYIQDNLSMIEENLKNKGCDDALLYPNYQKQTAKGVPSGAICVVIKNGEERAIAEELARHIYSAYMFGFGTVKDAEQTDNYCETPSLYINITNFYSIQNGKISFDINGTIITSDLLDFTSCQSLSDIRDVLLNDAVLSNNLIIEEITSEMTLKFTSTNNDEIKMIATNEDDITDIYGRDFFDGANQVIVKAGEKDITHNVVVDKGRFFVLVTYNESVPVQAMVEVRLSNEIEDTESLRKYILEELRKRSFLDIGKTIYQLDVSKIVDDYLAENNITDSKVLDVSLKTVTDTEWGQTLYPENLYNNFVFDINNIFIK